MIKHSLNQVRGEKNDAYVSDAVMIFADEQNLFEGTILEKCSKHIDVILINLKPGESIKEHKHITSEEIVHVLEGSGKIIQPNQVQDVIPQDIVFLEKDVKHGFEAGPNGMKLLAFHGPPMHERIS